MSDTTTDWNMEWDATNDCYSLTRINNGGVEQIDLFVDEPTAKSVKTAVNCHAQLLGACQAAAPLLLLAIIKAPDQEYAEHYRRTLELVEGAMMNATGVSHD
jgi:hypothetical protein